MNTASFPLVSIGMPLYNEARFIEMSLSCILSQDYPNLEIIISDNGSTDETLSLCLKHVGERSNVVIHRSKANQGAAENFRVVLRESHGKYFMWASGHDCWATNFVSENVALMEAHTTAVISFGTCSWIDAEGRAFEKFSGWTDTRGMNPLARLFTVFWGNMHPILGLIRKSTLDQCRPMASTVGADLLLLAELALQGDFVHATNTAWQRREFRHESSHDEKLKRYSSQEYGLTHSLIDKYFPLLRLPLKLAGRVVHSENLTAAEKIAAITSLIATLPARYLAGKR